MQETNFKIEKDRQEKVEWRRKIEMIKTKLQQMIDALDEAPELGEDPEFDEFVNKVFEFTKTIKVPELRKTN